MKTIFVWGFALLSFISNEESMKTPEQTVIGLFIATDQQNWQEVTKAFANEVLLDYSSMNGSPTTTLTPKQIITAWKGILPGFEHTHHQLGNFTSKVDGTNAQVSCYGTASHYMSDEGGSVWLVVGTYDFELEKIEGSWKVGAMKFNFKYQDGNTSLPKKAINSLK